MRLAAKAINGTILNPGDEFSYNGTVGERTAARGYQEAHAYSGGKIIDEFGGGVCQPSSTLYMAVLRADLKVTERHNHSFTVSYTPLGEDATVDYGNLDFRFVNNTAYPVKILAEQTDGQMIMTIVGTKTSDKTVTTRTEVLETYKPETVTKTDSSMEAGDSRVETSGITGYSTKTYKQITENGKTTEVLANSSTYSKRDEVVYVGE
ncbi:MAG: VanW family protein [Butyricicoccus sp.]